MFESHQRLPVAGHGSDKQTGEKAPNKIIKKDCLDTLNPLY